MYFNTPRYSFYTEENIQWLAPLRQLPLFFYQWTYHCDFVTDVDHGNKIRTVEGLMMIYFLNIQDKMHQNAMTSDDWTEDIKHGVNANFLS